MPIIIKVGRLPEILWALVCLAGVVLASSGIFNALNGLSCLGNAGYTGSAAISYLGAGVLMFGFGVVVIAAGYFVVRGKIIFVRS